MKYSTRINSYLGEGLSLDESLSQIGSIEGLDYVDLNYPEHFKSKSLEEVKKLLDKNGLKLNAVNLRFRDKFINGDLGNLDPEIGREAEKLSLEAVEVCEALKGSQIIFWLGHDGFDYSFQLNYTRAWKQIVNILKKVAQSTSKKVSIEYKPYEERATALIDSFGTAGLLVNDVDEKNFGVTVDYCHVLMKRESPAFVVASALERGILYNVHLNDGHGSFDDGHMVGTNTFWQTLETMYYLKKHNFDGVIYFDTFPKRERAREETLFNMRMCTFLEKIIDNYGIENIENKINENNAILVSNMLIDILEKNLGGK
ncbi:sugar phosphate isomerase/epimerase family protein [Peptoniphilaceae bacterium SGI.131]